MPPRSPTTVGMAVETTVISIAAIEMLRSSETTVSGRLVFTRLAALPVEVLDAQRRGVDVVEAAGVDRRHRPLRALPARERADAAPLAEQVMDHLPVELVVGERLLALLQRERARWNEREQGAAARADGAVALDDGLREIDVHAIADGAAVATAVMGLDHAFLRSRSGGEIIAWNRPRCSARRVPYASRDQAVLTAAATSRPSSLTEVSRILYFWILPVTVMGKPSTNFQNLGILYVAIRPRQNPSSPAPVTCAPSFSLTQAITSSPYLTLGTPIT